MTNDLTAPEVAYYLGVSVQMACQLARTGIIKARLGHRWEFDEASVKAYKRKRDRAAALVGKHGVCDCGRPAEHIFRTRIGPGTNGNVSAKVTYKLCDRCMAIEERS